MYYPINYGYIEGVMAPDGEEQDAYILGVNEPVGKLTPFSFRTFKERGNQYESVLCISFIKE